MKKGRSRKTSSGRWKRAVSLALFAASGAFLYVHRCDLQLGVMAHLLRVAEPVSIEEERDLPSPRVCCERAARVVGIPDYKNLVRLPSEGGSLTCYRMLDFRNRVVVCSRSGLKPPEDIEEIIRKRSIEGGLVLLRRSPQQLSVRRGFRKAVGVSLPQDTFLLVEGKSPTPSREEFALLASALAICCFSLYRVIKGSG